MKLRDSFCPAGVRRRKSWGPGEVCDAKQHMRNLQHSSLLLNLSPTVTTPFATLHRRVTRTLCPCHADPTDDKHIHVPLHTQAHICPLHPPYHFHASNLHMQLKHHYLLAHARPHHSRAVPCPQTRAISPCPSQILPTRIHQILWSTNLNVPQSNRTHTSHSGPQSLHAEDTPPRATRQGPAPTTSGAHQSHA